MNHRIKEIIERFNIEAEAALRIYSLMQIDFSECTQAEFDREALFIYESISAEECNAK